MPLLKRKQKSAAKFASSFAPKTAMGIAFCILVTRLMVRLPFVVEFFIGREMRDQVELPDYGFLRTCRPRGGEGDMLNCRAEPVASADRPRD
jgi:hypothetical protein